MDLKGNLRYKKFIEDNFKIVDKKGNLVDFILNDIQKNYLLKDYTGTDKILKARQEGFSSLIDAMFAVDFLMIEHSHSIVLADIEENAEGLLSKVKLYLQSYEDKNKIKVPLKYNSRYELYNEFMDSKFTIGTAKNAEFGRSKTIMNLHLSELFFYPNIKKIIAGAGQAVVEGGRKIAESTANGFNEGKIFWDEKNGFKQLFYGASRFYNQEFLVKKKEELKELYPQEYPENDIEAFVTSGKCYFDKYNLQDMLRDSENYPVMKSA